MKRRSDKNDYHGRHIYMLTLVVEGRRPLFGEVKGDAFAPDGDLMAPRIVPSPLGLAVKECWEKIPFYHSEVQILAMQLMPDHLHGILWVREDMEEHLGQVISGFKAGCNKAYRELLAAAVPQPTPSPHTQAPPSKATPPSASTPPATATPPSASTPPAASAPPSASTPPAIATPPSSQASPYAAAPPPPPPQQPPPQPQPLPPEEPPLPSERRLKPEDRRHGLLFEKGYNDLIAKDYEMLPTMIAYVKDNPHRLLLKRARPEFLRPFFNLRIGKQTYSGIGNRALLTAPRRMAVRVSRRLTAEVLDAEVERYLTAAQEGTVLVSPAISPGEKRIMRTAFDSGLPTIVIMENGFTPLSKPHGEQMKACAEGRLLMLAPWEHHNDKRPLTAAQCSAMNLIALEIANPEDYETHHHH
ncbi:MAG: hypothetical protein K6B13_09585 [Prevotella sp.]|nr:hypothetical protein [Prevotella sp.]